MAESVETRAIELVACHYRKLGWQVVDVSRRGGEHAGIDLIAKRAGEILKLEVKGSSKPYIGIPDLYDSEVDEHRKLRADFLCVAYFPPDRPERLAIIQRDFIHPESLTKKISYRRR